jgi:hypothetical protein
MLPINHLLKSQSQLSAACASPTLSGRAPAAHVRPAKAAHSSLSGSVVQSRASARMWLAVVGPFMIAFAASSRSVNELAFDSIYRQHKWGGDGVTSSLSGSGSSLAESKSLCAVLVKHVAHLVRQTGQSTVSLLDAAMGDWWVHNAKCRHSQPGSAKHRPAPFCALTGFGWRTACKRSSAGSLVMCA